MKILIVKLSSLGDVVHAMPALEDLRCALPQAQIDWVVERDFAPLVRRCRGVHRVIACELRRWRRAPFSAATRLAWRAFKAELQVEAYDAVIDLQGLTKSALIAWLARLAPEGHRFGLANRTEGSSFEAPARWLAHEAITLPVHIHAVTRSRELCARALRYALPGSLLFGLLTPADPAQAATESVATAVTANAPVAFVHGTSRADKQWPSAAWVELGQRLLRAGPRGSADAWYRRRAGAGAGNSRANPRCARVATDATRRHVRRALALRRCDRRGQWLEPYRRRA